jgi:hypothetical protein
VNTLPRGTIKSFREYLNAKFAGSDPHKHERYHQRSRGYGDYLYNQDRFKFDVELQDALHGAEMYKDWQRPTLATGHKRNDHG